MAKQTESHILDESIYYTPPQNTVDSPNIELSEVEKRTLIENARQRYILENPSPLDREF